MHYDEDQGRGQFLWTHTTASMGIAYQTTSDVSATTCMSRINDVPRDAKGNPKGTCILVESVDFATKSASSASSNVVGSLPANGHCSMDTRTSNVDGSASSNIKIKIEPAKA